MQEDLFNPKTYIKKLQFISQNAKRIDHEWFNPEGLIVWVNDIQYTKKGYIQGYYAMNRKGKFCFVTKDGKADTLPLWDSEDYQEPPKKEFVDFDPYCVKWLFTNVSVNSMLWRVNRIYDELM